MGFSFCGVWLSYLLWNPWLNSRHFQSVGKGTEGWEGHKVTNWDPELWSNSNLLGHMLLLCPMNGSLNLCNTNILDKIFSGMAGFQMDTNQIFFLCMHAECRNVLLLTFQIISNGGWDSILCWWSASINSIYLFTSLTSCYLQIFFHVRNLFLSLPSNFLILYGILFYFYLNRV